MIALVMNYNRIWVFTMPEFSPANLPTLTPSEQFDAISNPSMSSTDRLNSIFISRTIFGWDHYTLMGIEKAWVTASSYYVERVNNSYIAY